MNDFIKSNRVLTYSFILLMVIPIFGFNFFISFSEIYYLFYFNSNFIITVIVYRFNFYSLKSIDVAVLGQSL